MEIVIPVLGFAALFAVFGILAPVLRRRSCGGESCGSCSGASCKYTEQEQ